MEYAPPEELEHLRQEVNSLREELTAAKAPAKETAEKSAGTYNNGEKYCLVVADRIPTDAIIGAPVVVTIGSSTVSYPLLRCNGAQVVAGNLRSRYRYSTVFSTNVAGGGAFRLLSAARRTLRPA